MVDNNDLIFFVFVVEQLRQVLILLDTRSRKIQCLSNVILLELLWFSEVDQQEICLNAHG